ncbi:hypothetical protein QJS83_10075 [Bdellovibrio sp. 22V]|uniref:hypothetical protein n=1 Tax=Bdellovibrio sp. 22V TaxID=3044166 RepID=UPI002543A7BF|nr:hypothetical protein [Bdellovibrio sp. 22V]WII70806.1 hypothetical protein QJS83_10075 [Bdellovibrio sp. 22V]
MNLRWINAVAICILPLFLSACGGGSFQGNDFSSRGPASAEPTYYGKPTDIADAVTVTIPAKFLYRPTSYTPNGGSANGLEAVVSTSGAVPIPFAEFHIYDSSGARVQQGETTTKGVAVFEMPKTQGTYTIKVFSRAYNDYYKVSILEDIYSNTPYSISTTFTITSSDISSGAKDLTSTPIYAQASEYSSAKIEGGAFNIMYDILLANEYIRRNIGKNGTTPGVPTSNPATWWVAEKVTVYWKAGFNPITYFTSSGSPLSFYSPGERKLYILGGVSGDVRTSDTDHFDDSVILHEYGHFLEDVYGNSESPGGSHNGNFVIDPRLAWSEGWANYFQGAVLTGADAFSETPSASESRMPAKKRYHYYVDSYGYKGSSKYGIGIAFNLADIGTNASMDAVGSHPQDTGIFREVSIARTLYKSTRATTERYPDAISTNKGGGISFQNIWKVFSGDGAASYSLKNTSTYPIPNGGLFNWLLVQNGVGSTEWTSILTEERQAVDTSDYAYYLDTGTCSYTFTNAAAESTMGVGDTIERSDQQMNNDFFLYYHNGASTTITMDYSTTGTAMDLDLILYYGTYVYFEDDYWNAGYSSPYVAKYSRTAYSSSESISLSGLPAGYYMLNVKVNTHGANSAISGTATYTLKKNGSQICGKER